MRLHAYHSERVLARSPFLATLAGSRAVTTSGSTAPATTAARRTGARRGRARVLAVADAYHAMTEPRPHREARTPEAAAETLGREAGAGRLDADAVSAVLEAAGHRARGSSGPRG